MSSYVYVRVARIGDGMIESTHVEISRHGNETMLLSGRGKREQPAVLGEELGEQHVLYSGERLREGKSLCFVAEIGIRWNFLASNINPRENFSRHV